MAKGKTKRQGAKSSRGIPVTGPIVFTCAGPRQKSGGRTPCGADVTELIEAVPEDGQEHKITCPQCSTVATVRRTPKE